MSAASVCFHEVGYHNVSMADIAGAVGITAGALYRHFRDKQSLLDSAVSDSFERLYAVTSAGGGLDAMLTRLAEGTVHGRELGLLWEREARHLPAANQQVLRRRFREVNQRLAEGIGEHRAELSAADADLLGWAVLCALGSTAHHTVELDVPVLVAMTSAICAVRLPDAGEAATPPGDTAGLAPVSRREALLAAATRLFGEHGYQSVSMAEIGAAAAIAGPSVYNHFASKTEILLAALNRGTEALWLDLHEVLRVATSHGHALDLLVDGHVRFALRHRQLMGALVTEIGNLPLAERNQVRMAQRELITEWVSLLRAHRPELSQRDAHLRVRGALIVIADVARTPHLVRGPAVAGRLGAVARALLFT
ncbi:TetR/AcrR family transcriptional regulator [Kutzneria albida]|uniref:TetR/AcrR family transcriptional regulator n=1 Tax=Kutzneria albida TaxID=43357 RepID=UPI00228700F5|nr:TetR/AcrR family transcriptional regulator [Kutzneria albida]